MARSFSIQAVIREKLFETFGTDGKVHFYAIGGGSINETYRLQVAGTNVFCKINSAIKFPNLFQRGSSRIKVNQKAGGDWRAFRY